MKVLFTVLLIAGSVTMSAQLGTSTDRAQRKGRAFVYWGWNRAWFTNSDLHLKGEGYDFTLSRIVAKDRPTDFDAEFYFNPVTAPIPQYDFRLGYYFKEQYSISFGLDHMKYVMQQYQTARIHGTISGTATEYNGTYSDEDIVVSEDLLTFEHTDGLNYANLELRRFDEVLSWKMIKVGLTEGVGAGILYPKTNARVLDKDRYDAFHLAGYGLSAMAGLNLEFYSSFFLQSELKGGFIHLPDIRTTSSTSDRASQSFFFAEWNWVIGASFRLIKPKS